MNIGDRCRQTNDLDKYGFNYVGCEFEITKVDENIIMGKGNGVCFGIEKDEFDNYFELIKEDLTQEDLIEIYDLLNEKQNKYSRLINKIEKLIRGEDLPESWIE